MGTTTYIKNLIIEKLQEILGNQPKPMPKILSSQFDEDRDNKAQTSCEINVFYQGSDWTYKPASSSSNPGSYDRILNFDIRVKVKNLKTEDSAQDLNDLIIENLSLLKIGSSGFYIVTDSFDIYDNGIWIYVQSWEVRILTVPGEDPICSDKEISFNQIKIHLIPTYNFEIPIGEKLDDAVTIPDEFDL